MILFDDLVMSFKSLSAPEGFFCLTFSVCFFKVQILCILHSTCTPLATIQEKGIFHKEGERCGDLVSFSMLWLALAHSANQREEVWIL